MWKGKLKRKSVDEGQSIEQKIRLAQEQGTNIEAISDMIYTNAKDGVIPEYDIRADRQEIALAAIDHYQASEAAKTDSLNVGDDRDVKGYIEQTNTQEEQ